MKNSWQGTAFDYRLLKLNGQLDPETHYTIVPTENPEVDNALLLSTVEVLAIARRRSEAAGFINAAVDESWQAIKRVPAAERRTVMKVSLVGLLRTVARLLPQNARAHALALEEVAGHVEQVRRGEATLAEFCEYYGLPATPMDGPGLRRLRQANDEIVLAAALDAFNRHEHLGKAEALRRALETVG